MLFSLDQFCKRNSISRATAYREIASGRLEACKIGKKTAVAETAERVWRDALPKFGADRGHDIAA
ncbi:hypothetical protein JQ594_05175 [Bradyrhizobium manausense]|uniref:hypothetical protein n=1 Tax=Bradyrhizobium manausense TaxID=989370 RepID=UPI001BA9254D|nr:hypothetical protein [Bradyrhizobium manausense]MBR0685296.1 hypothetical protein [Bradyrhizobium manausense]